MSWTLAIVIIGAELAVIGGSLAVIIGAWRARSADRKAAEWRLRQLAQESEARRQELGVR